MNTRQANQTLYTMLAKTVVPAFLAPLSMLSVVARLIPDRVAGRALAHAAITTIPIPSALAALGVTVFMWQRVVRQNITFRSTLRSAAVAASVCAAIALGVSSVLVGAELFALRLFADAIPSSVIGGAIAAVQISKVAKLLPSSSPITEPYRGI